jgi:hypothetical protein
MGRLSLSVRYKSDAPARGQSDFAGKTYHPRLVARKIRRVIFLPRMSSSHDSVERWRQIQRRHSSMSRATIAVQPV